LSSIQRGQSLFGLFIYLFTTGLIAVGVRLMAITDMDLIEGREARAAVRRAVAKTREAIVLNYERKRKKEVEKIVWKIYSFLRGKKKRR
jgi:hypothetical protein